MRRRYEGLIRSQRPAPWPARWIVLATTGEALPIRDRPTIRRTGLARWDACILEMGGASVKGTEVATGAEASGAWRLLASALERTGPTWVLSARALRDWTLLGLWERLETGSVKLAPPRFARTTKGFERGLGREPGLLMAGDPPCVASLLVGDQLRKLTWVCQRNFGWGRGDRPDYGAATVQALAAALATVSRLLSAHRLGGWRTTAGAMALASWQGNYQTEVLYVDGSSEGNSLESSARFGGRVHAVSSGHGEPSAYAVDGRSLYARLLFRGGLAGRGCRYLPVGIDARRLARTRSCECCARVVLTQREPQFPCQLRGETVYQSGRIETTLAGPELADAMRQGIVNEIGAVNHYELVSPFADFALACYRMRLEAESEGAVEAATLAKALAVSLVGKLAQHATVWEEVEPEYDDPLWGEWYSEDGKGGICRYRSIAGLVSRELHSGLSAHAVPIVPVWVWSAGRLWLWERMQTAGLGTVLYADTDGLIVSPDGYAKLQSAGLIRSNEWGELRYVCGPVPVFVHGPKRVQLGERLIQAGAPREQRNVNGAPRGYWFRQPFAGSEEGWLSSEWIEEFRELREAK